MDEGLQVNFNPWARISKLVLLKQYASGQPFTSAFHIFGSKFVPAHVYSQIDLCPVAAKQIGKFLHNRRVSDRINSAGRLER